MFSSAHCTRPALWSLCIILRLPFFFTSTTRHDLEYFSSESLTSLGSFFLLFSHGCFMLSTQVSHCLGLCFNCIVILCGIFSYISRTLFFNNLSIIFLIHELPRFIARKWRIRSEEKFATRTTLGCRVAPLQRGCTNSELNGTVACLSQCYGFSVACLKPDALSEGLLLAFSRIFWRFSTFSATPRWWIRENRFSHLRIQTRKLQLLFKAYTVRSLCSYLQFLLLLRFLAHQHYRGLSNAFIHKKFLFISLRKTQLLSECFSIGLLIIT